jgi:hypothetical protein
MTAFDPQDFACGEFALADLEHLFREIAVFLQVMRSQFRGIPN